MIVDPVSKLHKDSTLVMHELVLKRENESEVLAGRTDISRFVLIPNIGAEIIVRLQRGQSIAQIEQELCVMDEEPVDVLSFVIELTNEYEFVHQIDGEMITDKAENKKYSCIPPGLGAFLFHPVSFAAAASALVITLVVIAFHPGYLPTYRDFFLVDSPAFNISIALAIAWILLFLHEMGHLAAARTLGISGKLGFGYRFIFPVAETDISAIILVPRSKRYTAYLAGMLLDSFFFMLLTWIQVFNDIGCFVIDVQPLATIRLVHFHLLNLLLFQFMVFMKTDMYYVVTTMCRCDQLLEHTRLYLRQLVGYLRDHDRNEWADVAPREKKLIYIYVWFYILGILGTLYWVIFSQIPLLDQFYKHVIQKIAAYPIRSWSCWEGILVLTLSFLV